MMSFGTAVKIILVVAWRVESIDLSANSGYSSEWVRCPVGRDLIS